jgi:LmbE family N-acetylglucosaminyl deacetylase
MKGDLGTILVSAHPDDVALSIGGSILAGYFRRPLLLVSVFTYGGTAPFHRESQDIEVLFELMLKEDRAYAEAINSRLLSLDMTDAALSSRIGGRFEPLRWVSSVLRGPPPPNGSRFELGLERLALMVPRYIRWSLLESLSDLDAARFELREKLSQIISKFPEADVACPLSIGLHPDHVLVSTACRGLASSNRMRYYEDLPYSMNYRLDGMQRHIRRFSKDLRPVWVNIEEELDTKLENLKLYKSQLGPVDIARVSAHARRLGQDGRAYERLWVHGRPR